MVHIACDWDRPHLKGCLDVFFLNVHFGCTLIYLFFVCSFETHSQLHTTYRIRLYCLHKFTRLQEKTYDVLKKYQTQLLLQKFKFLFI